MYNLVNFWGGGRGWSRGSEVAGDGIPRSWFSSLSSGRGGGGVGGRRGVEAMTFPEPLDRKSLSLY